MNSTWRNLGATAALGRFNIAIGYRALSVSTASYFNIAIGDFALQNQRFSGAGNPEEYNIAIGYQALQANTTGRQNVAIGFGANAAGNSSTTLGNISIGFGALTTNNPAATSQNTAIGYQALNQNRLGIQNFAMGYNSSFGGTFGSSNIAIGVSSNMYNNGSSNIFIGNESGVPIGNIQATQSNGSLFLANYNFNIGIGQWTHRFTTFYDSRFSVVTPPGEILPVTLQSGNNLAIGYRAFEGTTASFMTLFSGATALPGFTYTVSSSYNVAIGNFALGNNQGLTFTTVASQKVDGVIASYSRFGERIYAKGFNTAVGYNAMNANVTGFRNTAVGGDALAFGSHSTNNIAIGFRAGANLGTIPNYSPSTTTMITGIGAITTNSTYTNTADFNIAIGNLSLHTATAASRNIAIGHSALRTYSTQLGDNVAIGFHTLRDTTTGNNNTAIGSLALAKNTTGTNNIGIGGAAGTEITTGTNNLGIGGNTLGNISTTSNNMALGFNAMNNASSTSTNNIGIGVQALASVSGSFNTVVGVSTAQLVRADSNTVIGFESMYSAWHASISGVNNRSAGNATLGLQTLAAATGSSFNVAIGAEALRFAGEYQRSFISGTDSGAPHFVPVQDVSSTTPLPILRPPTENIAIGYRSMQMPMSGLGFTATDGFGRTIFNQIQPGLTQIYYPQFQVGIGNYTLQYNQGSHSVAIGYQAMANALNSSANVAIGYQAMQNGSYSIANIAIGWRAGQNLGNLPVRNTGATAAIATAESFGYPVSNIAIGYNALTTATSSKENIAIGTSALRVNRGGQTNVAIGGGALSSNTWGIENIAIGQDALRNLAAGVNTSGAVASYNVAVGTRTMQAMVSGYRNYALGYSALSSSIDGQLNVAIGHSTLLLSLSHSNVSIGYQSLPALQLGHNNIAIGAQAAPSLGGGTSAGQVRSQVDQYNTIIGNYAASGLTSGSYNTIISSQAGTAPGIGMTSGDYNIHIGYGITGSIDSNVNNTVIGSRVTIGQGTTNSIILANGSGQQRINVNSLGYLGVGTQSPSAMLTVNKQTGDTNTTLVNFTSDSQGILLPRLTTAQILAISSPADGLTVYNTDQQTINFYRGGVSATWSRVTYTSI
jgi:hypothetical protein